MQEEEPKPFEVDHAKTGRSMCKKCKMNINVNEIRIARLSKNPFGGGLMKSWNHKGNYFIFFIRNL